MPPPLNLTGQTLGTLEFIEERPGRISGCVPYLVRCIVCKKEWVCLGAHTARRVKSGNPGCLTCSAARVGRKRSAENENRRHAMVAAWVGGETMKAVGTKYGLTTERVRQIIADGVSDAQMFDLLEAVPPDVLFRALRAIRGDTARRVLLVALADMDGEGEGGGAEADGYKLNPGGEFA